LDDQRDSYEVSYDWDAPDETIDGEEYYEEEYYEEEAYEGEEYYEEEPYEEESVPQTGRKRSILAGMTVMDKVIAATGAAVLILAFVTAGLFIHSKKGDDATAEVLADVGASLEGISTIGERGLIAIADAQLAKQVVAEVVEEEEQKEYDEAELSEEITVKLNMSSVLKDLKIKFVNKSTGKLVSNVPFAVEITTPDGKTEVWRDDDRDGIIYKKNIAAGTYKVLVKELEEEQFADYVLPIGNQSVEVKGEISYEKIDVSDEVKTEAEIDVAKEDTQVNDTAVESSLQDTVAWVDSSATANVYKEVPKSEIPDPMTLALTKTFQRISQSVSDGDTQNVAFKLALDKTSASVSVGGTATAKATVTGASTGTSIKYSVVSGNTAVATASVDASGNITVKGVAAGTAQITLTAEYASGTKQTKSAVLTATVAGTLTLQLDKSAATVYLTVPVNLVATTAGGSAAGTVSAVSSNTAVATVAVSNKTITITPVAVGDAVITVQYSDTGATPVTATCAVKVLEHPKNNKTALLKDASGNQLYVMENNAYREAVYADYYTAANFYIRGDVKYTGWQTIDGKVYFFTAAGEKVTGDQVIQGAQYHFASDGSLVVGSGTMGIDVSKWNGTIDWKAVKNSGVSYVIIRCGYRGSSQGMLVKDPKFQSNIAGAIAADIKVGVYFFTQAVDEVEAVEEASFVLDMVKGYKISYPIFLDVESSGGRADKIDKATRTAVCKTFCETIKRGGYTSGIYANKTWLNEKIDAGSLNAYKIWLAQYASTPTYQGRYDMWQYKSTGKVSGIKGDVDLNLSYLGY